LCLKTSALINVQYFTTIIKEHALYVKTQLIVLNVQILKKMDVLNA
jgi:hypothetical protein